MKEGRWQVMAAYRSVEVVSISDFHTQTAIDLEVLPAPSFSDRALEGGVGDGFGRRVQSPPAERSRMFLPSRMIQIEFRTREA